MSDKKMNGYRLVPLLCVALICAQHTAIADGDGLSEFNRGVKQLSAKGFPVSLDDLEERYVLDPIIPNAGDIYVQAFEAYVKPTEEEMSFLPFRGMYEWDHRTPLPPEVLNAIASSLKRNRITLELVDKASRMEHCRLPRTRYKYFMMTDHLSDLKKTAQLLSERNLCLAHKGQPDVLCESLRTTFAQTHCCSFQPFAIDYLVMIALQAMAVKSLEDSLNLVDFTDEQCSVLSNEVRKMRQSDAYKRSLISERVCTIEITRLPASQQMDELASGFGRYDPNSIRANDPAEVFTYYENMVEATKLTPFEHLKRTEEIFKEFDPNTITPLSESAWANRGIVDLHGRVTGNLLCGETALAIERYRLKRGRCPQSLRQLVPEFLKEVPVDPFDGKPIRYHPIGDGGYTLYTIGEDRKDNGGLTKTQMTKPGDRKYSSEYDWPFTVRKEVLKNGK